MINTPKYIVIHHSAVATSLNPNQFNSIDNYHKSQAFTPSTLGYYVGYHKLVTGGQIYKCREDFEEGCHTNQSENGVSINLQSLAVCWGGNGDVEFPSEKEKTLIQQQVKAWQAKYNIPNERVLPHRHWATFKSCPGNLLDDKWFSDLLGVDNSVQELTLKISLLQKIIQLKNELWTRFGIK